MMQHLPAILADSNGAAWFGTTENQCPPIRLRSARAVHLTGKHNSPTCWREYRCTAYRIMNKRSSIRTSTSESEREIVLEIFRFGYEAAEKELRQDKMVAYQRLLRAVLHQPSINRFPR